MTKPILGFLFEASFYLCATCARKRNIGAPIKNDPRIVGPISSSKVVRETLGVPDEPYYMACLVCGHMACEEADTSIDAFVIEITQYDDEDPADLSIAVHVVDDRECVAVEYWIATHTASRVLGEDLPEKGQWTAIDRGSFSCDVVWRPGLFDVIRSRGYKLDVPDHFVEPTKGDVERHRRILEEEEKEAN